MLSLTAEALTWMHTCSVAGTVQIITMTLMIFMTILIERERAIICIDTYQVHDVVYIGALKHVNKNSVLFLAKLSVAYHMFSFIFVHYDANMLIGL